MKQKPIVCLIDEDENVKLGWMKALGKETQLVYFQDHLELFNQTVREKDLMSTFSCIIVGRYFRHLNLDVVHSAIPDAIKSGCKGPLFLNWQGYITKDEVNSKFDGKLFHRYGVKWQTLRLRIIKFEKNRKFLRRELPEKAIKIDIAPTPRIKRVSRPEKCEELLLTMAKRASGEHRRRIQHYAFYDKQTGMQLLEAIYNKLLTDKNRPASCPSRYINSSPVIAQRILYETLYS